MSSTPSSILVQRKSAGTVPPVRAPSVIVIGGGSIGARSVRQLLRARAAGRLETDAIVVVDRDPRCAAAAAPAPARLEVASWSDWLREHLASADPEAQLVPYHWAPHLLEEWLEGEVRAAGASAERGANPAPRGLPFESATRDSGRAFSYAAWPCPPLCIEPALCPHTRGPRDWSLAADLERPAAADAPREAIVFRSMHFVYGIATIRVGDTQGARDRVVAAARSGGGAFLVSTASHCHALAATLRVIPVPGPARVHSNAGGR